MALGIVSVVFIPLMGLLPVGLAAFRGSMDDSVVSQIAQQVSADAMQSEFEAITSLAGTRYFDDQSREMAAADAAESVYQARVVAESEAGEPHLKRVIIQVVRNPGEAVAMREAAGSGRWREDGPLPVVTRSLMIARNSGMRAN